MPARPELVIYWKRQLHPVRPVVTEEPQKWGDTMDTHKAGLGGWNREGFLEEVRRNLRPQDDTGKREGSGETLLREAACAEVWSLGLQL